MFVGYLPNPDFVRCSAPKYPFLKCYGALHLLVSPVTMFLQTLAVRCTWLSLLNSHYPKQKGFTFSKGETVID
jgi:hypothetical protein